MRRHSSVSVKWCGQTSVVTRDAAALGPAHQLDAAGARDVHDVDAPARGFGQQDVAGDHDILGHGRHAGQAQQQRDQPFVHDAAAGQLANLGNG